MEPAATATPVEVDTLLERLLEQPEPEWSSMLESLCASHPGAAPSLRRRFELLAHTGLVAAPPRPELLAAGQTFGGYRLLELVGAGGMGVVFRARRADAEHGDDVALKVLRPELLAHDAARSRFLREAEVLRGIAHPAVCSLVDFGEHQGAPFLVMPFVRGRTLAAGIAEARKLARPSAVLESPEGSGPPWRALCTLFAELADGLAAVHAQGLVHRDVKPENVIVRAGSPVLIDFGLASVPEATRLTRSGEPLGTPAYMAPEQVRGAAVDVRTDVYGLAASLYEAVTLRPPFLIASREALYRAILTDDVADVRASNPQTPRSLALVLHKALQKDPGHRYASACAFGDDLRRVVRGEPVTARPPSLLRRVRRVVRRHPLVSALVAAGALLVSAGVIMLQALERSRRDASEGLAASSAALVARDVTVGALVAREAWRRFPDSETTRSNLVVALSRNLQVAEFPVASIVIDYVPSPDGAVAFLLSDRVSRREGSVVRDVPGTRVQGAPQSHYLSAAWSLDGQRCLIAGFHGHLLHLARDGSRLPLAEATCGGVIDPAVAALRSAQVVAALGDGCFVVGDKLGMLRAVAADGTTLAEAPMPSAPEPVVLVRATPDAMAFVTVDLQGEMLRWDRVGGTSVLLRAGGKRVTAVVASPARRHVAIGDVDGDVHVVDVETGACVAPVGFGAAKPIESIALAPDGTAVFATALGQRWGLWQLGASPSLVKLERSVILARACSFSPDGTRIAFTDMGGRLTVVDRQGRTQFEVAAHRANTAVVHWTGPDTLVTGGLDPALREWRTGVPGLPVLRAHEYAALAVAWLPDSKSLVSSGADGRVVWSTSEGRRLDEYVYPERGALLFACALSPDGGEVACVDNRTEGRAHRLRLVRTTGRFEKVEPEFGARAASAAWQDAHTVILGNGRGEVTAWDVTDGRRVREWKLPDGAPAHGWEAFVTVGRDGRIATVSNDGHARLWNGDCSFDRELLFDGAGILAVDFAADGEGVLVGSSRGWVGRYGLQGTLVFKYEGGLSGVIDVGDSPDGRFVAAVGSDGYLQVWTRDGTPWLRLPHPGVAHDLAFSPDSQQVAVACSDGAIHVWPVTEERIARLAADIFRDLTSDERRAFLGR